MKIENESLPVTVEEIQALRKEILQLHESLAKDMIGHSTLVQNVVNLFVDKGLEQRWVEKLLAPLVGSSFEEDEVMLVAYLLEEVDNLLKVKEEASKLDKRVHILIGGTGIGKTSLVGKLGARYTYLLEEHHKVAFFNFDYQKVGAIEQLEHYSDAMDIPIISVEELVDDLYDVVLIDTAGNMCEDGSELNELIEIIEKNSSYRVKISLVLSATAKRRDLERMAEKFKEFPIESFIFTKLDETSDLSDMINFLMKKDIPLGYLSIGQAIPEDLVVASKEYLLNQFMHGVDDE